MRIASWADCGPCPQAQVRGLGNGLAATANWLTNAVVSLTFLPATKQLGASTTFGIYALLAAAGGAWLSRALPETKGAAALILLACCAVHAAMCMLCWCKSDSHMHMPLQVSAWSRSSSSLHDGNSRLPTLWQCVKVSLIVTLAAVRMVQHCG